MLDLTNFATKKLEQATGVDRSDLAAEKGFVALKAEADKLVINKLVNVQISLNNFLKKVDNLDIGKLKTFAVDLEKLSHVVSTEVLENIKFNTLKITVTKLDKKIPYATILNYLV